MRIVLLSIAAAATLGLAASSSHGASVKAGDCEGLKAFPIKNGQVTETSHVQATATNGVSYCRARIVVKPEPTSNIRIEVWLPDAAKWNGKFLGTGNGGAAGQIQSAALQAGVNRGYAVANTDMGTSNGPGGLNMVFGLNRPELQKDFAYRSTDAMTIEGKRITAAFYGKSPAYSYFQGCSTGGYQAWEQIHRLPNEYDGVIAGAAANDRPNLHMTRLWNEKRNLMASIPKEKLAVVTKAAVAACDAIDGLKDGIIDDPRACNFDPRSIVCKAGDGPDCLTQAQAITMQAVYDGARNPRTGALVYPGFERGAEAGVDLHWEGKPGPNGAFMVKDDSMMMWSAGYRKAHPDGAGFDFDKDVSAVNADLRAMVNYTDPNLTAFQKSGGKVIAYHGWADSLVPSRGSPNYYERIAKANGGYAKTQGFARLFMVPGMAHCRGGVGPDQIDFLAALENWVEKKQAPATILATRPARQGLTALTRPLCPYPAAARYTGKGDPNDAANFTCKAGKAS